MSLNYASSHFFIHTFQELYREILIQKAKVHALEDCHQGDLTLCERIQHKLRRILEEYSLVAQTRISDFAVSHYQEALYVMVGLADEIFLSFSWSGQQEWENKLLEMQFFKTQTAGEHVFTSLDALIRMNDPVRNDIAIVYLMALCLGFRGKFRGTDDHGALSYYRRHLMTLVRRDPPTLYTPGRDHLIEEPYMSLQALPYGNGLPNFKRWMYVFGGIVIAYLFISSSLWHGVIYELTQLTNQIIQRADEQGGL